ncbi:MAG: glycosyltransferase family 32 protein [Lachnospiraceae bacterium]
MLKICNCGRRKFIEYIQNKHVYIFGAGTALESCLDIYCNDIKVDGIIDNSPSMWGKIVHHHNHEIKIMCCDEWIKKLEGKEISNIILLISTPFYAFEIISQLDVIPQLDGLETFLQIFVRNTIEPRKDFSFSNGEAIIPKKIHYIWVGGKELPEEDRANIETWKKYNPDYEIIRWDESNYDIDACAYAKEAYEAKEWGFFSNYVRLDIIYNHGGIYLDTDVEVTNSFDCLICDNVFFNMGCGDRVNNGCGFGAVAGNSVVGDIKNNYLQRHFRDMNGKLDKRAGHLFIHDVLRRYGLKIENEYQNKNGVVLYPMDVMSPLTMAGMPDMFSDKTISIHKEAGTWKKESEKKGIDNLKKLEDRIILL